MESIDAGPHTLVKIKSKGFDETKVEDLKGKSWVFAI
jgi:hypothetical protein